MSTFWQDKRVVVTGGAGFLGSFVVERIPRGGRARRRPALARLRSGRPRGRPPAARRRAARRGHPPGGAGRRHRRQPRQPGPLPLRERDDGRCSCSRSAGSPRSPKLVATGTICAYPKFAPVPFKEDDLWNGYPGGDQRALRHREEDDAGAVAGVSRAVRHEQHRAVPGEPVRAARQLRSASVARDPGDDPQVRQRARRAATARSCCGATARRRASSSTSRTPPRGSCWPPSATTPASR